MDKRLARMMNSGVTIAFVGLVMFAGLSALFSIPLAIGEALVILVLYLYYRSWHKTRATQIRKYVENLAFQMDDASKHSIVNFPLPMIIMRLDTGEVIWGNDAFNEISGANEGLFGSHITDAVSDFDTRWLMEGKTVCPYDVGLGGRKYHIYGNIVRSTSENGRSLLATLFWVDVTEYSNLRADYEKSRPVVAIIMLDSQEELFKGLSESEKSALSAEVDEQIMEWAEPAGGIVRLIERGLYLFVFENQALLSFAADKFTLLDKVRQIKNSTGIRATLSIGIGKGNVSFHELHDFAGLGLDMALSRGGDQVAIKSKNAFEFYGGSSKEVEKRTKVKSRVIANALMQLIRNSSAVFIMGHQRSDIDCIGAAAGICSAARKCGKQAYILANREQSLAGELIRLLSEAPEYSQCFISEEEATVMADASSLLIVVDTCRPDIVESPTLLQSVNRIAVIDHHRRAASYIENATISLHEPYASSTSELVAELLQYIVTPQDVLKIEAEALLGGISLDTKSFTVKTGVRTFEAAAYLKQLGADTIAVKKLFSGGLDNYVKKYKIIASSREEFPGISLAVSDIPTQRATAAQAADELINLTGIDASFVVYSEGNGASISARSYGKINVQVVLEKLGGGGSLIMAGAQFPNQSPQEVAKMLHDTLAEYLKENRKHS